MLRPAAVSCERALNVRLPIKVKIIFQENIKAPLPPAPPTADEQE